LRVVKILFEKITHEDHEDTKITKKREEGVFVRKLIFGTSRYDNGQKSQIPLRVLCSFVIFVRNIFEKF